MSLLSAFFRRKDTSSASVAKERLTLVLAHERGRKGGNSNFLPDLKREIIAVVAKYVKINEDQINVRLDDEDDTSILEINIELPQKN